ncbi:TolC family protein, partial [Cupriavidus basilensis]
MLRAASIAMAAFCMTLAHAAPLPLADMLNGVDNDPALKAEYADLDAARSERSARESEKGWQVFAGGGIGDYHELVVDNVVANYYGRNLSLGMRYPLLGSLKRQVDAVKASGFAVQRQQLQLALRRAERRLALRSAYADWWRAQQEQSLCGPLRTA